MFTYLRPDPEMPALVDTLEAFWERLPSYQRLDKAEARDGGKSHLLAELNVSRVVFGWFPTYRRNAPLAPSFDRILSIGDASAVQSPISFGGFCAMLRHLPRLSCGLNRALRADALDREDLRRLTPYLPNLGSAWMSSAAMTARPQNARVQPSSIVNQLLEGNFKVMGSLPRSQALTFFRDVTTFETLMSVLIGQTLTMSTLLPSVVAEIGALEIIEFSAHLTMLALYTAMHTALERLFPESGVTKSTSNLTVTKDDFRKACQRDAFRYGSGLD